MRQFGFRLAGPWVDIFRVANTAIPLSLGKELHRDAVKCSPELAEGDGDEYHL